MISKTKTHIDADKIGELLAHAFGGDVKTIEITELNEGLFNALYSLRLSKPVWGLEEIILKLGVQDGKHILHYEKEIQKTELYVYRLLPGIGVPSPKILYADSSHTLINCDYFFMEKLTGDTWEHLKEHITPENEADLERELGEYTAKLHSVKGDYFKMEEAIYFREGYEKIRPFVFGENEKIRLKMYWVYVALMIGVEIYRYELEDREETTRRHSDMLLQALEALK